MIKWKNVLAYLIAFIIYIAISFSVTAGLIKVLSLCFGFAFSWKLALGIWVILVMLKPLFSSGKSSK